MAAPGVAAGRRRRHGRLHDTGGRLGGGAAGGRQGALVVVAGRLRRDSHIVVSLALTGALMLGLKPALARDVSFQLSFAGTIGIATLTDGIAAHLRWIPLSSAALYRTDRLGTVDLVDNGGGFVQESGG